MMNLSTNKIKELFQEDGFVRFNSLFSKEEIMEVKLAYNEMIEQNKDDIRIIYEEDGQTIRSVMGHNGVNKVIDGLTYHPNILNKIESLLETDFYVSQNKINTKAPAVNNQNFGKKWDYHRGYAYWNLLDGMKDHSMISVVIFLSKQSVENGALFVLKGSHKGITIDDCKAEMEEGIDQKSNRSEDTSETLSMLIRDEKLKEYQEKFEKVVLEGEPGDVVFMDSRLLHASDDNFSDESRDLMIPVYNPTSNVPAHPREDCLSELDFTPVSSRLSLQS